MSETQLPQLPYDIIDNIITKMKMIEAKEMVADLPKYINYKKVTYDYQGKKEFEGEFEAIIVNYIVVKDSKVATEKMYYPDNIYNELYYLPFENIKKLRRRILEFNDYQKQLKKLGMKPMSKMNKHELIKAILKLE